MAQDQMLALVDEQLRWLRLIGLGTLRTLVPEVLKTEKQRLVYELSDGTRTVRDIAGAAGVGIGTVSRLWTQWLAAGLCFESTRYTGRAQRLTSLAAVGIDVPTPDAAAPSSTGGDKPRPAETPLLPEPEEA